MKAKRDYKKPPRRSGGDRRSFAYAIYEPEKREKIRRCTPDRRNLTKLTRMML